MVTSVQKKQDFQDKWRYQLSHKVVEKTSELKDGATSLFSNDRKGVKTGGIKYRHRGSVGKT